MPRLIVITFLLGFSRGYWPTRTERCRGSQGLNLFDFHLFIYNIVLPAKSSVYCQMAKDAKEDLTMIKTCQLESRVFQLCNIMLCNIFFTFSRGQQEQEGFQAPVGFLDPRYSKTS